jgi:hypothetical protein
VFPDTPQEASRQALWDSPGPLTSLYPDLIPGSKN